MIDCRLNNRRIVFESLCTICAKLSSISLISYFVLCNFWLEIVAKQYAPRSLGWECPKERDISHTIESFVLGFSLIWIFWFCVCVKLRKFAHRSINEWLYRNCDRCDRSMNRHASYPHRELRGALEWWVKQICKFAHIINHLHVFLSVCLVFFSVFPFFLMISGIFESEFN